MSDEEQIGWTQATRLACADWCACYGEPPCWKLGADGPCVNCINGRENPDWDHPLPEDLASRPQ